MGSVSAEHSQRRVNSSDSTDYLVVGAGASGLAFVDTLLTEGSPNLQVVIIDRRETPGGHWSDSYEFVRLHQPASFYGVNSERLENGEDPRDLSSGPQVHAYFVKVMQKLLDSGRVRFFPNSECSREALSTKPGTEYQITSLCDKDKAVRHMQVRCKVVDAAYLMAEIPSTRPAPFKVEKGARVVPVNAVHDLAALENPPPPAFVIVGSGKTGIDAITRLITSGIAASQVRWVVPSDPIVWHRGAMFFNESVPEPEAIPGTKLFFLHNKKQPNPGTMRFRCATVGSQEFDACRQINDDNIVRLGKIAQVTAEEIVLEHGRVPLLPGTVVVDCAGDGLPPRKTVPVFDGAKITLQTLATCQVCLSAAIIAKVECAFSDQGYKNKLCTPVSYPSRIGEMAGIMQSVDRNMSGLKSAIGDWLSTCRLVSRI